MKDYNFKEIEKKWQKIWADNEAFKAIDFHPSKPKYYTLLEFPYPSGAGMHVGNMRAFSSTEVVARKRRLEGYNVLYPIGFDSFGLPAEAYAIKNHKHPQEVVDDCIKYYEKQFKGLGWSVDWTRETSSYKPEFYKWTQWIFLQMYKKGIAYRALSKVNFCEHCKCVLANEDSEGGVCDRCHNKVVQKEKMVWFLKIRAYAERLLEGLDRTNYLESVKAGQRHWIGKTEGLELDLKTTNNDKVSVYTTRADTVFGVTFIALAPEHPILQSKGLFENEKEIQDYIEKAKYKKEFDRKLNKDKTGVELKGVKAINPFTGKEIPMFVSDYVIGGHGTGAVIGVPAHDTRDYDFAKKHNIEIIEVVQCPEGEEKPYCKDGKHINSEFINGLNNSDAIKKVIEYSEKNGIGRKMIEYAMTDWAFNRQRYWGEPIPVVYCEKCGIVPLPESELPLVLPRMDNYEPSETGDSPLSRASDWVNTTCPHCGGKAKRETDTMPQWAGSSAYWLRFMDPHNNKEFVNKEKAKYWNQVDWYSGGQEHVTRHMLYARFWHKFLYDIGVVDFDEPFMRRTQQGLILNAKGEKMSKSDGSVVDPLYYVEKIGADSFRTYIYFMGDFASSAMWSEESLAGCERFIKRVWKMQDFVKGEGISKPHEFKTNALINKVSNDIENVKFNTAIAALMDYTNFIYSEKYITKDEMFIFTQLLYPFAPHIAEEIAENIGCGPVYKSSWPKAKLEFTNVDIKIPVQVNGKLKFVVTANFDDDEKTVISLVKSQNKINIDQAKKVIFVKNKIINFII